MIPARVIAKKRDGGTLTDQELRGFLRGFLDGGVEAYQMTAFLMAVYFRGLDSDETDCLVREMLASGARLDFSHLDRPCVDKHSTGGVGDKVSIALAPLVASLDIAVPMMSGRGLGHTTGTLDKLDAIPGFRTQIELPEFEAILEEVGCAMIGQTESIAPLDRRLYALRDVTATVPVIPLIAASIMSKKLAEGLSGLVLDVKVGAGAFIVEEERALELARTMVGVGHSEGLPTVALVTAMDRPLGRAIGNALETIEAIACLRGEGPPDLEELVVAEAVEMARVAYPDRDGTALLREVTDALRSGRALDRFIRLVEAQGGDPSVVDNPARLRTAAESVTVTAERGGVVATVDPRILGEAVVALGGGRRKVTDDIDPGVGFELEVRPGDAIEVGAALGTVHAADAGGIEVGREALRTAVGIGAAAGALRPLISHRVTERDVVSYEGPGAR